MEMKKGSSEFSSSHVLLKNAYSLIGKYKKYPILKEISPITAKCIFMLTSEVTNSVCHVGQKLLFHS